NHLRIDASLQIVIRLVTRNTWVQQLQIRKGAVRDQLQVARRRDPLQSSGNGHLLNETPLALRDIRPKRRFGAPTDDARECDAPGLRGFGREPKALEG